MPPQDDWTRTDTIATVVGVTVHPLGVEALSNVRYIHTASLRARAGNVLSEAEIKGFSEHVYSDAYAGVLARLQLLGASIGGELVGTVGWSFGDDSASGARIAALHVRPMFTGLGIGRTLLTAGEAAAAAAGFDSYALRATPNAVGFFERQGYVISSHGTYAVRRDLGLPVAFMRKIEPQRSPTPVARGRPVTTH